MLSVHDEEPEVDEDHEEQEPDEGMVQLRSFAVTEVLLLLVPLPGQGHPLGQGLDTWRGITQSGEVDCPERYYTVSRCRLSGEALDCQERWSVTWPTRERYTVSREGTGPSPPSWSQIHLGTRAVEYNPILERRSVLLLLCCVRVTLRLPPLGF